MKTHQEIGKELDLFSASDFTSGGAVLYHPKGAALINNLKNLIEMLQLGHDYQHVITPHVYKNKLWETSGHAEKYKDKMFFLDDGEHAIKPMNCPAHILIYKSRFRNYKELPLKLFEFATVYRNEQKGELNGLFRCRSFTQDDSHIFTDFAGIEAEVRDILALVEELFDHFHLVPKFYLSSSPKENLDPEQCAIALEHLRKALDGISTYEFKEGEGAFYGPKIDVAAVDAAGREWQLSTIQLDLNLPRRFNLSYQGADNQKHVPVIIHRALVGSLDRFLGILLEHYQGIPPMLLSMRNL